MSLDLKVFQSSVEKMSPLKPIPNTSYADTYIKGFYVNDPDGFIAWCKEHKVPTGLIDAWLTLTLGVLSQTLDEFVECLGHEQYTKEEAEAGFDFYSGRS